MHVCTHAIHTNLKGNFQLVYMCLIWLLQPEEKKLQQNPEGLNCHKRMDVKKAKPVLWTRFPAGVLQGSCLSPAGLCPGQTLLSWHVDTTSQCSALSFPSFSWKIPAETTSCLLFCCQVVLGWADPCPLCSPRVTLSCDKCEHKAMPTHAVPAMSTQREHQSWSKIAGLASSQVLTESCFHIPWKAFNKCHQIRRCSVVIRAGWHHQGDGHCLGWWPAGPAERHKLPDSGEERDPNQDLTPLYSIPSRSSSAGDP